MELCLDQKVLNQNLKPAESFAPSWHTRMLSCLADFTTVVNKNYLL